MHSPKVSYHNPVMALTLDMRSLFRVMGLLKATPYRVITARPNHHLNLRSNARSNICILASSVGSLRGPAAIHCQIGAGNRACSITAQIYGHRRQLLNLHKLLLRLRGK